MTPADEARIRSAFADLADAVVDALRDAAPAPEPPVRLLSIDQAAEALGIGRTATYDQIRAGRLRSVTAGRRRLIPADALAEFASADATRTSPEERRSA